MPVKLKSVADAQDAMCITADEYNQGRANFVSHYVKASCDNVFLGQDIQIPWATLQACVNAFMAKTKYTEVALRFVYCFDVAANALYFRLQICKMDEVAQTPGTYNLIETDAAWYKIIGTSMTPSTADVTYSNTPYKTNFYYCANPPCSSAGGNTQQLAADTTDTLYARTITFPWVMEILEMYKQNGSPANAKICFGATSYVHANSGESNIAFPHGVVMYLRTYAGVALLNNDMDTISVFHNKGVDYGTLCPKQCNVYVLPAQI